MSKRTIVILLLLFYGFTIFLTLNRHSNAGIQNYHSEIWADKAGYYIYLPAYFIYEFDGEELPDGIGKKTGDGFFVEDGKIKTKYTSGVAILQAPFFLATHFVSTSLGYESGGFSPIYHNMINISAVTYSFFALILLYLFLIRYVPKRLAFISVACIYLGTNLFYYSIFETGMSHIYSFFLFSFFLYLSPFILKPKKNIAVHILFGLIVGLIILIRPLNILFLPAFFILHKFKLRDLKLYIKSFLIMIFSAFIVIVPQFIYWKYASGSYLFYSYSNEGFTNLFSLKLLNIWFSPNNGLFIYSPLVIFALIGIFMLRQFTIKKRLFIGAYFLFISLVIASWHDWTYGCSYGCRPYVEYYAILALPFSSFLKEIAIKKYLSLIFAVLIVIMIIYTMKIMFSYDGCWYGGDWDWEELYRLLISNTK